MLDSNDGGTKKYPLLWTILIAWSCMSALILGTSLLSGDISINLALFGSAVIGVMSCLGALIYFYRRYYLWFGGAFVAIVGVFFWQIQSGAGDGTEMERLAWQTLPFGIVAVIFLIGYLKLKQHFFGSDLVSDDDPIVEQGLHPERHDLLAAGLFLIGMLVVAALLRGGA